METTDYRLNKSKDIQAYEVRAGEAIEIEQRMVYGDWNMANKG